MEYKIIRSIYQPEMNEQMALWFHEKWCVPLDAYLESMEYCLTIKKPIPQWYVAMEEKKIIGDYASLRMISITEKTLLQMFVRSIQKKISVVMEWQAFY